VNQLDPRPRQRDFLADANPLEERLARRQRGKVPSVPAFRPPAAEGEIQGIDDRMSSRTLFLMKTRILPLVLLFGFVFPAWAQKPSNILLSPNVRAQRFSFLSASDDGSKVDLWPTDDGSGRQRWIQRPGPGGHWCNILISGGMKNDRKYLSVNSDGTKVDLFTRDNGSGRQRWVVEKMTGDIFHIRIFGGVDGDRKYLGLASDGRSMQLFPSGEDSIRQHWRLPGQASAQANQDASAEPEKPKESIPVGVDAFTFGGNSARYRVTNGSPVALTAYAVQGGRPSGQPWTHVDDLRIMQNDPLTTGQSHLGDDIWNTFEYPRGCA